MNNFRVRLGCIRSDRSRLVIALAADGPAALVAISSARAAARKATGSHVGGHVPDHYINPQRLLIIDLNATLVTAHSEKEKTAPNFKRGVGFHPLLAFVGDGPDSTGEPLSFPPTARKCRIEYRHRPHLRDLTSIGTVVVPDIRFGREESADSAGGTHAFLEDLTARKLSYSVGFTLTDAMAEAVDEIAENLWIQALDSSGIRNGAWVVELTGLVHL